MAEKNKQCKMIIYEGLGHGAYDEAEDFNRQVLDFLNEIALEENVRSEEKYEKLRNRPKYGRLLKPAIAAGWVLTEKRFICPL